MLDKLGSAICRGTEADLFSGPERLEKTPRHAEPRGKPHEAAVSRAGIIPLVIFQPCFGKLLPYPGPELDQGVSVVARDQACLAATYHSLETQLERVHGRTGAFGDIEKRQVEVGIGREARPSAHEIEYGRVEIACGVIVLVRLDQRHRLDQVPVNRSVQTDRKDEANAHAGISRRIEDEVVNERLVRLQERTILLAYGEIEFMGAQTTAPLRMAEPPSR